MLINYCGGQSFTILNYSLPEGLPSSEVYEIYQDRNGFLWFATDNGVAKYDGHEMLIYHMEHGLSDPAVFGFHEDIKGRLWFRTYSGKLSFHENGKIFKYRYNEQLSKSIPNNLISSIYYDSIDQLWFSAGTTMGRIDSTGKIHEEEIGITELYYKNVGGGTLIGSGNYYKGIRSIRINDKVFNGEYLANTGGSPVICSLTRNGKLYITFDNRIFEFDGERIHQIFEGAGPIISLSTDIQDRIWIGYLNHPAERFDNTDFKDRWVPDFLKGGSVTKVLQDHERGLWISTLEKGVFYIPNFLIENRSLPTTAKIRTVASTDQYVFVGDQQGTVQALSKKTFVPRWTKTVAGKQVIALLVDSKNQVWVSGYDYTSIIDPQLNETRISKIGRTSLTKVNDVRSSYIAYISNLPDSLIWAMGPQMLFKYNNQGDLLRLKNAKMLCRTMLVDDSLIFVGGRTGLFLFDRDFNFIHEQKEFSEHKISHILNLNDSTLVITTIGHGFLLLNKNRWTLQAHNTKNKFISNYIYAATKIDTTLWLGTEKGVVKVGLRSLLGHKPSYHFLTKRSGLISNKINFILHADPDVWVFTDAGFSVLPPEIPQSSGEKPLFYIKNILVNKFPLDLSRQVNLLYDQNNIQIAFGFIAFKNQNILTRYRLKAGDSWNYANLRNLEFYALAPGNYQLELEYSIDNNNWTPVYHSPPITIQPPIWQTWYFQATVAVLVLLVILIYVVSSIRTYKLHQQKLIKSEIEAIEHERSRIAKELHDSVGTDLTAIKMVVRQRLKKTNDPKTDDVELQFQNTIREIKSIIYDLAPPGLERYGLLSGLKNYVDKLNGSVPLKIEMKSFGPEIMDHKLSITVFRVIQELISNSLKHSNAETITLHINAFDDLLNIIYEDNGKGFSWDENHKGLGLYNIESRIQSVKGKLTFESGAFGISYFIDIPMKAV